jgi:SAM-dependent methyltransferase
MRVADDLFEHPRLAAVYDTLDPDRSDLDVYAAIVAELGARLVLDVGCGTGTFALVLAGRGVDVVAVDPAGASLDVAGGKPGADKVRWVHGDATAVPEDLHGRVDLAVMTGNVAQAIVDDRDWRATLTIVWRCLRPGGHLVFETRRPQRRGWQEWTRERSETVTEVPGHGFVRHWVQLTEVDLPLVTFDSVRVFEDQTLTSSSTLRFRSEDEISAMLAACRYDLCEVREAPDRPGRELVFMARRPEGLRDGSRRGAGCRRHAAGRGLREGDRAPACRDWPAGGRNSIPPRSGSPAAPSLMMETWLSNEYRCRLEPGSVSRVSVPGGRASSRCVHPK